MKHSLFHMMDIPDHSPKGSFLCLRITSPIPAINTRNVSHLWWCNIFHLHNFLPAKGLFPDQILFNYKIYVLSGFLSYNKAVYHNFKIPIALLKQHYVFSCFLGVVSKITLKAHLIIGRACWKRGQNWSISPGFDECSPVFFLLNIVYFSVCLTSNKLYWIDDQLADVSARIYMSASWSVGELTGYRFDNTHIK